MREPTPVPPPVTGGYRRTSQEGLLFPLDLTYAHDGLAPPAAAVVRAEALPAPYHGLLVHEASMTLTLEAHFADSLLVRPLSIVETADGWLLRRVLLALARSGRAVEMGAIRLRLDAFEPAIRTRILEGRVPLGRLLRDGGIEFRSVPELFLAVTPNAEMAEAFGPAAAAPLYGRRAAVMYEGERIGDTAEVLCIV
jgi:chorismate-pyruvate lyase